MDKEIQRAQNIVYCIREKRREYIINCLARLARDNPKGFTVDVTKALEPWAVGYQKDMLKYVIFRRLRRRGQTWTAHREDGRIIVVFKPMDGDLTQHKRVLLTKM